MSVYTVVLSKSKSVNVPSTMYSLDLLKLLDGQELLDFSHDDFVGDQFSQMIVQAKDLNIYVIDFEKNLVVKKIDSQRHAILRKSVFFDHSARD